MSQGDHFGCYLFLTFVSFELKQHFLAASIQNSTRNQMGLEFLALILFEMFGKSEWHYAQNGFFAHFWNVF